MTKAAKSLLLMSWRENPERYGLTCLLPWYGTLHDKVKVDTCVKSGTHIKWNEYDIEIFHLGGQTYYHAGITIKIDGEKVIFTGDSCFPNCEGCETFICYNDAEPFSKGYAYAVERLIERTPTLLVSGHGMALKNPHGMNSKRYSLRLEQSFLRRGSAGHEFPGEILFSDDSDLASSSSLSSFLRGVPLRLER